MRRGEIAAITRWGVSPCSCAIDDGNNHKDDKGEEMGPSPRSIPFPPEHVFVCDLTIFPPIILGVSSHQSTRCLQVMRHTSMNNLEARRPVFPCKAIGHSREPRSCWPCSPFVPLDCLANVLTTN
jgi:hypothetical protein